MPGDAKCTPAGMVVMNTREGASGGLDRKTTWGAGVQINAVFDNGARCSHHRSSKAWLNAAHGPHGSIRRRILLEVQ